MMNEAVLLNSTGNMYQALVGRGKRLEQVPGLATEWKQTSPTVWRFKLRSNVKFHDGTAFSADDILSLQRAHGEGSDQKLRTSPSKRSERSIRSPWNIVTHEPFPILPGERSRWYIMSKAWCEKHNAVRPADVRKGTENFASNHAIGTGLAS
jgi:peptide/nickel transport system substrate-binding protein